jgi:hypothetical protein
MKTDYDIGLLGRACAAGSEMIAADWQNENMLPILRFVK